MFDKIALAGGALALAVGGYAADIFGSDSAEAAEGRIYHYVRSNRDGTDPENVYVYRAAGNRLEVYKSRERCTSAAYVSAWVDSHTGRATMIQGGRLMPNARHENFATLSFDGESNRLAVDAALPDRAVHQQVRIAEPVYHLYDFDLASLSVQTMGLDDPRAGFSFGLPLVLTQADEDGRHLNHLGTAEATFVRAEDYHGTAALRFEVGGSALGANGGPLWLDADTHHVLGAEWGIPNHAGMQDFAIRLADVQDSGESGWTRLLTQHFEGCGTT
ncbi:hypothetical protein [Parasphingopyxis marina]|uniref:Uncharacterized protein n=1 Tax=Parasphingopyxis marina TaxID=2761622 RepID=A0A842HW58_9SPHN|nr:hypothetical protein [Parasphingopyxis marina]MBC2777346.1 hypothetical protein [Parasphingopyxis marina]